MGRQILAVNPGSTSTKIALYEETRELWKKNISHAAPDLAVFRRLMDQLDFRAAAVRECVKAEAGFDHTLISAVVGRGGLLKPLPGGVYAVNQKMKDDLASGRYGTHASNLGALIADVLARELGVKAYIVDPVVVDELDELARYSGLPEIPRRSIFHALNQKATARKAARSLGKRYADCSLIVAHMGGGTSIGVHVEGKVVDVNNALDGEGPISIERAGTLPAGDWMRYVLSRQGEPQELQLKLTGKGGLVSYLGTNDFKEMEKAAASGTPEGELTARMIGVLGYQISKSIAALSAVVCGRLDAVVLTGGLAFSPNVVEDITRRVSFLAPVLVFPGENELEALAHGVLEALDGAAETLTYGG